MNSPLASPLASAVGPVASDSLLADWGTFCNLLIIFPLFCCFFAMIGLTLIYKFCGCPESSSISGRESRSMPVAGLVEPVPMALIGLWVVRDQFQGEECVICLGGFDHNYELVVLPICGHVFHSHCLAEWLNFSDTCPTCRLRVGMAPVFPIHDAIDSPIPATAALMEEV